MVVPKLLRTQPLTRTQKLVAATARLVTEVACLCRLLPFIFIAVTLSNSAHSAQIIVQYLNIRQLLENATTNKMYDYRSAEQFSLKCHDSICMGKLPLIPAAESIDVRRP
jgi:hypothetical protein